MFFQQINEKITDKNLLFFIQRFLELTSYMTSESYKSKMMMSVALCDEYLKLYNHKFEQAKKVNLKYISEELIDSLRKDTIIKKVLRFNSDEYIKKGLIDYDNIDKQNSIISLIMEEVTTINYINVSIDEIINKINSPNKANVILVINNLISLLNYMGMKNSYLFNACKNYFQTSDSPSIKDFFHQCVFEIGGDYDVFLGIMYLPKHIDSDFFEKTELSIEIIEGNKNNPLKGHRKTLKFSKVTAHNPYNAIEQALELIEKLKQAYIVLNHSGFIQIGDVCIAKDKDSKCYVYNTGFSSLTHQKKCSQEHLSEKFTSLFKDFTLHNHSLGKFQKALKLHYDAINSKNMENQLTFFWNALESLAYKDSNKSIIDNVEKFIMPFIKKRYFTENFIYIYTTLDKFKKTELADLLNVNNLEHNFESFAKIIVLDKFSVQRKGFLDKLNKDFPLMIDRIYELNNQLSSPRKVLNKLIKHENNVEQQLRRIYRHRNLIIHDDSNEPLITTLLSNLHNYFDYVLDEIIEHSYSKGISNIEKLSLYLDMEIDENRLFLEKDIVINEENFKQVFMLS